MLIECKAGDAIVFDAGRQAWFPDVGLADLSPEFSARGELLADAKFEEAVGMRSAEIPFSVLDRYKPAPVLPNGEQ